MLERFAPKGVKAYLPSPSGLGIAMVIPASNSIGMFLGAAVAEAVRRKGSESAQGKVVQAEGIVGLTRAFMYAGTPRVVCSLWKVDDEATRALDNGALGIVVPHVDTAAEARECVEKLKYPPIGHRSVGGWGPHYQLGKLSTGDAVNALNAANLTVVMLETPTAIANAAEIAAVPGVDVLLIGSNDLCAEMGIPGDFGNDRLAEAYATMIAACEKSNKFPGMASIYKEAIMPRYIGMGDWHLPYVQEEIPTPISIAFR